MARSSSPRGGASSSARHGRRHGRRPRIAQQHRNGDRRRRRLRWYRRDRATQRAPVQIDNVAPTADIADNGPVNEGSSATISLSNPFDPSSADTTAGFHYAFDCDGGSLAGATYAGSGTSELDVVPVPRRPGRRVVSGAIIDKDGGLTEYPTTVHGEQRRPDDGLRPRTGDGRASPARSATSTSSRSLIRAPTPSPARARPAATTRHPGRRDDLDGHDDHLACIFDDGPPDTAPAARPTPTAPPGRTRRSPSTPETSARRRRSRTTARQRGRLGHRQLQPPARPGPADTTAGFHYAFGCGNGSLAGATYAGSGTSASDVLHLQRQRLVHGKGRIIDKDNGFTEYTADRHFVTNVDPDAWLPTCRRRLHENGSTTLSGSFTDPGTADTPRSSDRLGRRLASRRSTWRAGVLSFSTSHQYLDDNPTGRLPTSYTISVTVTDDDAGSVDGTAITVAQRGPGARRLAVTSWTRTASCT